MAFTGDPSLIGSPCVDALVADGTVDEATIYDAECFGNITDNVALMEAEVDVSRSTALLMFCWYIFLNLFSRLSFLTLSCFCFLAFPPSIIDFFRACTRYFYYQVFMLKIVERIPSI